MVRLGSPDLPPRPDTRGVGWRRGPAAARGAWCRSQQPFQKLFESLHTLVTAIPHLVVGQPQVRRDHVQRLLFKEAPAQDLPILWVRKRVARFLNPPVALP